MAAFMERVLVVAICWGFPSEKHSNVGVQVAGKNDRKILDQLEDG
jgi:hypothetical protein